MSEDAPFAPRNLRKSQAEYQGLMLLVAENAPHVARARKAMFDALKSEGFTDAQALDLCWRV